MKKMSLRGTKQLRGVKNNYFIKNEGNNHTNKIIL